MLQRRAVLHLQRLAILVEQRRPVVALALLAPRDNAWPLAGELRLLVVHFQKEQERDLLRITHVRQPVVAQNVREAPGLVDDLLSGVGAHRARTFSSRDSSLFIASAFIWRRLCRRHLTAGSLSAPSTPSSVHSGSARCTERRNRFVPSSSRARISRASRSRVSSSDCSGSGSTIIPSNCPLYKAGISIVFPSGSSTSAIEPWCPTR